MDQLPDLRELAIAAKAANPRPMTVDELEAAIVDSVKGMERHLECMVDAAADVYPTGEAREG